MRDQLLAVGVATMLLACLTGCPLQAQGGGGGGDTESPIRQAGQGDLVGDQLAFSRAYARAPWIVTNLGAGDWMQALREVSGVQDEIVRLKRSETLRAHARLAIAGLQPKADRLAVLVQRRDATALAVSASLVEDFTRVAVDLSDHGWLAMGWDGGAGRGVPHGGPAPRVSP